MIPVLSGKYIKKSHKQFIVTIILFNKRLKKKKRIHNKNKRCFYETYVIIYFFQYFRTTGKFTFVLKNMNILCHDQRRTLCNVKTKQRMKSNYLVIIITAEMNEQSYTFLTIQIPIVEVCIETNTNLHILLLLFLNNEKTNYWFSICSECLKNTPQHIRWRHTNVVPYIKFRF